MVASKEAQMSVPSTTPQEPHSRSSPRERTLRAGKLFYGDDLLEMNCTVTDVSEHGARVRLPPGQYIQDDVWLMEVRSGIVSKATVAWRSYPLVGLNFQTSEHVDQLGGPQGRIFQRIWSTVRI
jgi:hypothetical protein